MDKTVDYLKQIISKETGVRPDQFFVDNRQFEYILSRHLFRYYLRKTTRWPLKVIADESNTKGHSTVINSIYTLEKWYRNGKVNGNYRVREIVRRLDKLTKDLHTLPATNNCQTRIRSLKKENIELRTKLLVAERRINTLSQLLKYKH